MAGVSPLKNTFAEDLICLESGEFSSNLVTMTRGNTLSIKKEIEVAVFLIFHSIEKIR